MWQGGGSRQLNRKTVAQIAPCVLLGADWCSDTFPTTGCQPSREAFGLSTRQTTRALEMNVKLSPHARHGWGACCYNRRHSEGWIGSRRNPNGKCRFKALPGTKSPTAGSEIVDGEFAIPAQVGLFAGKFRVTITASRPSGRKVHNPTMNKTVDGYEQYIPSRYNTASELEVDVERGATKRLEFALVSD